MTIISALTAFVCLLVTVPLMQPGLPTPPHAPSENASSEQTYAAERALLDGFRVIPLIHLPDVYGVGPRVKGGPGITPLGEWRFDNLWLEGAHP